MKEHQNMKSEARSEVLMPHGDSEFFFCPTLMMIKNIFLYLKKFLQFKEFVHS